MGYEIARLVNEIDDEFLCSICSMVLENAVQSPCEHAFCSDCIHLWLEIKETCPVDASPLALADIKPTPRYFRNILGKIKVKCDFESQGCQSILALEQLQQHLIECVFNANAELICDKGCNIKITRGEYETANCFAHLAKRQQEHFDAVTSGQREEILKLSNDIDRQREEVTKLNDELKRSTIVIERLQKEITKLRGDCVATPKWQICKNMKILNDPTPILEHDGKGLEAFAQFHSSLESAGSSFEIKILNLAGRGYIVIGLTRKGQSTETPPGYFVGSVGYCSFGHVAVNGLRKNIGPKWKNDDVVKVGIQFRENVTNDGETNNADIYFAVNGEIKFTEEMKMPHDGFFPTVYMWTSGDADDAPKVELLNSV